MALQNKNALTTAKINELDAIKDPEEKALVQSTVEAVRRKHQRQYQQKKMFNANNGSAYQPRTSNGGTGNYGNNNYSSSNNGSSFSLGAVPKCNNPAFGRTCHYCKKKNNFQAECNKRKRDNAPLVKVKKMDDQPAMEAIFISKN